MRFEHSTSALSLAALVPVQRCCNQHVRVFEGEGERQGGGNRMEWSNTDFSVS
ncbi:hypothetical protein GBF38_007108, partial [Nibea albiflora]